MIFTEVILYTLEDCVMCSMLKERMNEKGISFEEVDAEGNEEMNSLGICNFPCLKVDDEIYTTQEAFFWINNH